MLFKYNEEFLTSIQGPPFFPARVVKTSHFEVLYRFSDRASQLKKILEQAWFTSLSARNDKNEVTTIEIEEIPESIKDLKIETICNIIEVSCIGRKCFQDVKKECRE